MSIRGISRAPSWTRTLRPIRAIALR
jgi:hypothetical protein